VARLLRVPISPPPAGDLLSNIRKKQNWSSGMQQAVGPEVWTTMRNLASGAPPLRGRMAVAGRLHATTVRDRAGRDRWPRPNYLKAEWCWRRGDVDGTAAETAFAVASAMAGGSPRGVLKRLAAIIAERGDGLGAGPEAGSEGGLVIAAGTEGADGGGTAGELTAVDLAGHDFAAPDVAAPDFAAPDLANPDFASLPPDDRMARLAGFISRQLAIVLAVGEASGGLLDRAQLQLLAELAKLAEKFKAPAAGQAAEKQKRSDAEIAEILKRVDDRIVELARGHAEWLVARQSDG